METRVSLVALFRARDPISNIPRHRSALRGLDVLGDRRRPAAIASSNRAPSASAVRWHAIATSDTSDTEHTTRRRCTSTGKETSTAIGLTQRRSTFKNASRLPPPRAYVGDGSPEKEIIVLGDSAVILEDEEAKSRKLGWDTALSRVTLLQLATCAATGVAEPLLGTIDAYWVATLGTTALASLGPNTAVYSSVIAVVAAHGFGTAATRVMAVSIEKDYRARRDGLLNNGERTLAGMNIIAVTTTAVTFGAMCGLFIALFPEFVVKLVGVDPTVVGPASGYMRARALGVPAVCMIAVLGGAFQAARDAKTPLLAVALAGFTNLILDPSFIFLFKMGFQGAAYATVVAQYAEATLMWWFAFRGPRRVNFFGDESLSTESSELSSQETSVTSADSEEQLPATYPFDKDLAWKFFREATSMLGRVANVVAVWAGTSALAARTGVYSGAAHVLLFQILCIISIAAGAMTTVSNAVASRLQVSEGDSAASGAGAALSLLAAGVFAVIGAAFYAIRVPLLTNFTPDTTVVAHALGAYPIVMICVVTYWYKSLEGALIGRGDAKSVNTVFSIGGAVCALSLWWFSKQGPLTINSIWWSLFAYYIALSLGCLIRWVQLDKGFAPIQGQTFKTTPRSPIDSVDDDESGSIGGTPAVA